MPVQTLAIPRAPELPDDATRAIASTEPVTVAHRAALRCGKSVFRSAISAGANHPGRVIRFIACVAGIACDHE